MQMEHADYVELKTQLQSEFDGRYVLIDDCERTVKEESKKIDRLAVEFAKSNTKLNILIAILSTIAVPIVGVCVKMLLGG
jgi:hypothetical protein